MPPIETVNVEAYNFQDTTGDENKSVILEKLNEIIAEVNQLREDVDAL
jgi:hypothetical protein